jgi:hypothetical protein
MSTRELILFKGREFVTCTLRELRGDAVHSERVSFRRNCSH